MSLRRASRLLAAGALAAAFTVVARPAPAGAQIVVGTVVEEGTARPLEGAFVVLVDDDGRRHRGVLSDAAGRFSVRAPAAGRYRLIAELIGYRGATTEPIELERGPALRHDIEVAVQAVTLEGIRVESEERCRGQPGSGPETARLWEEARKALEVARWGGERGVLRFLVVSHTRELDARSLRVRSQEELPVRGSYDGSPFSSIPAEDLLEGGYIQQDEAGNWDFFAPDADVLLSDSFLDTHCFRVAGSPVEEPELVGLAFEPVPERALPDVKGVLWLERGTAELRRLDYVYENLPFRHGDWSAVGGRVEFERLATGVWVVRRWRIRMPKEARADRRGRLQLTRLIEQGAEVREVATTSGVVLAEAFGATLHGVVTRASDGAPIEGAEVALPALSRRAATASDGAFRLTGLPAGGFDVRVTHPGFQAAAGQPLDRTVQLRPGAAARLLVALEPRPTSGRGLSAGDDGPTWSNTLVGRVTSEGASEPIEHAVARLLAPGGAVVGRMVTDDQGRFRLGHPGAGSDYTLEVEHPDFGTVRREIRFAAAHQVEVDVVLPRP